MGRWLGGWVYRVITRTSDLFMNINKNRKPRTCQQEAELAILHSSDHNSVLSSVLNLDVSVAILGDLGLTRVCQLTEMEDITIITKPL